MKNSENLFFYCKLRKIKTLETFDGSGFQRLYFVLNHNYLMMKKNNFILLLTLFSAINAFSQGSFEKLFSKESTDAFRCVREVTAGGYVAAGYTADSTANDTDAFVVRLNIYGDSLWTFSYNGPLSKKDLFYKIINTSDGGFIACGYTSSVSGISDDVLYVKLNSLGQMEWVKTYGGSGKERGQDIIETSDGYTLAGYTTSPPAQYYDAFIIHTNFNGEILWTNIIGDSEYDDVNTIKQLADGGYILGGQSTNGAKGFDQFLIRTNISGDTLWTKRLGTTGTDNIESLTVTSDGFVLVGNTNTLISGDDGYLVKTDLAGNFQWSKIYGGSDPDDFHYIDKTSDGGFIISGTTRSYGALNPNMWLFKTNAMGDSVWARTFGGDNHDHGYSAVQTSDGGYIIAGYTGSFGFNNEDGYIVKIGPDGTGSNHLTYVTVFSLISPLCSGNASEVKVLIRNFGNVPVSNIPVTIEITGSITQTLNANYSGSLVINDVDTVTFSQKINTTNGGAFTFYGFTDIVNDVYPNNNSIAKTIFFTPCTGIEDLHAELGYSLYPNPTNGNVVVDFSSSYLNVNIELINITGTVVKSFSFYNTNGIRKTLDLSVLAKGLYLLKVSTEDGFDVRRIVLE